MNIGDRFGRWTIVSEPFTKEGKKNVSARCDCGTTRHVDAYSLQKGRSTSCGSCNAIQPGDAFGRWMAVSEPFRDGKYTRISVRCKCGTERCVQAQSLLSGDSKSCGCSQKELARDRLVDSNTTHGMSRSRLYSIWKGMIQRCTNPSDSNYEDYGGRGIWVCNEWLNALEAFREWAESESARCTDDLTLTLDRIDTNDGYYPENCRFTTKTVQAQNRRKRRDNRSGYIGVYLHKGKRGEGRYRARATVNRRLVCLGFYDTPIEAARVRDDFVSKWYEAPMLNFPEEGMKA